MASWSAVAAPLPQEHGGLCQTGSAHQSRQKGTQQDPLRGNRRTLQWNGFLKRKQIPLYSWYIFKHIWFGKGETVTKNARGGWELLLLYCMLFRCLFHDKKSLTNADFLLQFVCWICVFYKHALFFLKFSLLLYLGITVTEKHSKIERTHRKVDNSFFYYWYAGYELRFCFSVHASSVVVMDIWPYSKTS